MPLKWVEVETGGHGAFREPVALGGVVRAGIDLAGVPGTATVEASHRSLLVVPAGDSSAAHDPASRLH